MQNHNSTSHQFRRNVNSNCNKRCRVIERITFVFKWPSLCTTNALKQAIHFIFVGIALYHQIWNGQTITESAFKSYHMKNSILLNNFNNSQIGNSKEKKCFFFLSKSEYFILSDFLNQSIDILILMFRLLFYIQ